MKKVVFFAIAIVLVSFLSSCALYPDQCPGVMEEWHDGCMEFDLT